ncbi:uncharacterized protein LOC103568341 [Microplitis demolitor]|uniref:uncharacterized protein LOC103568341 n=1 Tax=Microplitis demolitor TaxID=69319 RepID=UPI00235B63CC|nr:uncharacterized protein LOC103568341 [Microplitis demolitor]XP_053594379.1 uncharacterized protein LOC103568341 [Microplitis demolitor]XP_053594380.1 uncharacterized protein LOC103568341 [Microplitis demolitor]
MARKNGKGKLLTDADEFRSRSNSKGSIINDGKDRDGNDKLNRRYVNNFMKQFPELYRSDVSINPSYSALNNLPYYIKCRRRVQNTKKKITRQINREIHHIAMMQPYALASVRIDRVFSVGFPPEALIVPDFATDKERRRINKLMSEK